MAIDQSAAAFSDRAGSGVTGTIPRPAAPEPLPKRAGLLALLKALRVNPITSFAENAYREPIIDVGLFRSMLLVNDPEEIEHVLVGNAGNYRKSLQQQRRLRPALGDGLLTAEGDAWRSTRRVAAPLFNPKAIGLLLDDMQAAAEAMRQRWLERSDPSDPVDIAAEFQRLTYEIVSATIFSGELDADRARIHANMAIYFESFGRIDLMSLLDLPLWLPTPAALRAWPAIKVFRAIVDRVVTRRARSGDREAADLLDRLMFAPDPKTGATLTTTAVADNVLTFLAAGHETTGNALSWILYLLAQHPQVTEAVIAELASAGAAGLRERAQFDRMTYTRAVIDEALRLYPPAPFIGREAIGQDQVGGHPVRAGTQILISPWLVHRHRRLWDEPDLFRPERFLPGERDKIPRGAFIPFGMGPRTCIGEGFAVQEMLIVLSVILPAFSFTLADPDAVFPEAHITLRARGGLPMIIKTR